MSKPPMKLTLRDLFWLLFILTIPHSVLGEGDKIDYVRPFPQVMYAKADEKELKPIAEEVARLLGISGVQSAEFNPVCCVWLELTSTPNPGEPGYIILHQRGGTVIQASNAEQMQAALRRWIASSKKAGKDIVFPQGLSTSYKVLK